MDPLPIPDPLGADLQTFLQAVEDQKAAANDNDTAQRHAADAAGALAGANNQLASARAAVLADLNQLAPAPTPPNPAPARGILQRR